MEPVIEAKKAMRLKDYRNELLKRLRAPDYAAAYLAQVLAENDKDTFLIALKDVAEASGGLRNQCSQKSKPQ